VISERVISERVISERVISERVISERVISERVISERAMSERAISEQAISEPFQCFACCLQLNLNNEYNDIYLHGDKGFLPCGLEYPKRKDGRQSAHAGYDHVSIKCITGTALHVATLLIQMLSETRYC